jgi:hypothetical protein|tara:strand:- start:7337 stop:7858 length:522 start_codon:yes stop_codon:yes gene_type:complete
MNVPTLEEIQSFQMPSVQVGTPVEFYITGTREGTEPRIGFVLRISRSGRNVVIRTADGGHFDAVRHIADPKLQLNADQRENGAWDFTEFYKSELEERRNILERLEALEGTGPTPQNKIVAPAEIPQEVESETVEETYSGLRERAMELGIEFKGNPKRKWLEMKIGEATSQPVG